MTEDSRDLAEVGGGEVGVAEALKELGMTPRQLKKYVNAAKRIRELEKQYGKSYQVLIRDYEKKFKESVKLEYQISELLEKRARIEEDLNVYLEQRNLTLETVNKVASFLRTLQQQGVNLEDFENVAKAVAKMKDLGLDVNMVFDRFAKLEEAEARLKELNARYEETASKLETIEEEIRSKEERLRELTGLGPEIENIVSVKERLEKELQTIEEKMQSLRGRVEMLAKEYETLYGFKGSADEVFRAVEEKKAELERLDEDINKKKETLQLLEEEVASARSLLLLLQNPELVSKEDLETLIRQLSNIVSVKSGELPMLKPLEQPLVENIRKKVVELVMPAIRNELVPRWVFEKLEKELKEVAARKAQLEEEVEKLKASAEQQVAASQASQEQELPKTPTYFRLLKKKIFLSEGSSTKIRLKCPYCQTTSLLILPSRDELVNAVNDRDLLVTTCVSCGKDVSVDPAFLKERFYPG